MNNQKLKIGILFGMVISFGVLIFGGYLINKEKPPIPQTVFSPSGEILYTHNDIMAGQKYYLSRGGQNIGSIWGHGSYLAPDWSADFLHRMGLFMAARFHGITAKRAAAFSQPDFDALDQTTRAVLSAKVQGEIRVNRFDQGTGNLVFTDFQKEAYLALIGYYSDLFKGGNESMGQQPGIVRTVEEGRVLTSFFSWLSWAAVTERPGLDYTYTSNWPYDPLVGNEMMPDSVLWSIVSVILLILGIGVVLFIYVRYIGKDEEKPKLVTDFPEPKPTHSQIATLPYFLVAIVLFLLQIGLGVITAHFTVEGTNFYGISLAEILPYAAVRTWHLQLAVFFIATCFLAAGLFIGPMVGIEPKAQRSLVWVLFGAIVVVVVGSLSGTWLSVTGFFDG
ncbi:MAG: cbb3-type cytochrome c oxidase subunit I, partial [SAR324 cluster bacterium]|nr:cbb3-type cytochrome c oxidase subunit I [SAR324 cluster bacterium]